MYVLTARFNLLDMARNPYKIDIHHIDMPFFLGTQETAQRYGNHIAEFRSLLDANHIRHGSQADLFEFARILDSSNSFRIDLSALVKSIVKKEGDELLLTDMVSIIAASVGGPSFADTNADITKPTNILMEFLLGTGCWRQFGASLRPPIRAEESRTMRISPPASSVSIASENPENQAGLVDVSSEHPQTLSHLEFNILQVKSHLDSIEQRISRIESPPEDLLRRIPSPPEPLLHPGTADTVAEEAAQSPAEGIPAFEAELPIHTRAVFSRQPQRHQSQTTDDISSPTFAYSTTEGRNIIIPIGVFLVLLAIIAAALFFAHSGQGQIFLKASMSRIKAVRTLFSSVPATVRRAPTTTLPSTPDQTSASTGAPAPPSPAAPATSTEDIVGTTSAHSAVSDGASPNISADARPIPGTPKIRYISSNVMEGYLLSAPRPEYPPRARIDHIEGQVTLQATISKTGSIETLHVMKGPESLRSAAIDAARKWRYKPYLVDSRPIEVTTTVYVDFSLRPPPAIVQEDH